MPLQVAWASPLSHEQLATALVAPDPMIQVKEIESHSGAREGVCAPWTLECWLKLWLRCGALACVLVVIGAVGCALGGIGTSARGSMTTVRLGNPSLGIWCGVGVGGVLCGLV